MRKRARPAPKDEKPATAPAEKPSAPPAAKKTQPSSPPTPVTQPQSTVATRATEREVSPAAERQVEVESTAHVLATPATRKLARDLDVNIGGLTGTGQHGRVTKEDVQLAYETHQAASPRTSHPAPSQALSVPGAAKQQPVTKGALQRIPLRGIRKKISEAMAHSKHTAAHFTYVEEVDMTEVVKLRASVAEEAKRRNTKLTYLPFIIKGLIPALVEFPFLNSALDDEKQEVVLKGDYNMGIATDTEQGLMVPVIKQADRKSIWELAAEITELSEKVRAGKAAIDDLRGGTFTLTNAGSIGGVFATPIINHPEVAILGVNAIRKRPVVKDDRANPLGFCIANEDSRSFP
ncbi:MAG: 2-oxo acid dehydrogenase subunit E2 [Deltaproteobacteria bacterium]|nr:2-oxo acid dehydrogenase subunit E2 [Deltaproteobacteria bacterium]